jgi:hypothetical protein
MAFPTALAQAATASDVGSQFTLLANIAFGIIAVTVLVIFVVWIVRTSGRTAQLRREAEEQERAFAEAAIAQVQLEAKNPGFPIISPAGDPAPTPPSPPPVKDEPGSAGPSGPEALAKRLVKLRILTDFEGRIPFPLPPDGLIYRLRRGGSAAILPRLESAGIMEHLTRRFDLAFCETDKGEVLICERLQHRLPELIDDLTGPTP